MRLLRKDLRGRLEEQVACGPPVAAGALDHETGHRASRRSLGLANSLPHEAVGNVGNIPGRLGLHCSRMGPSAISLRTILFLTFLCACVSRLVAQFGLGLAVALVWCAMLGAVLGLGVGALAALMDYLFRRLFRWREPGERPLPIACLAAGLLGGFLGAAAAAAFVCDSRFTDPLAVSGLWFKAAYWDGQNHRDITRQIACFLLLGAFLGAMSGSIARAHWPLRIRPWIYVIGASNLMALVCGAITLIAGVILIIPLWYEPPHFSTCMTGALPFAIVLYCAIAGAIGAVCGLAAAGFSLWALHANENRASWLCLWGMTAALVLFTTEAALRGWLCL